MSKNSHNTDICCAEQKRKKLPDDIRDFTFFNRLGFNLSDEQVDFCNSIYDSNKDIVFCNSVAGSGKTTLAVATSCLLVELKKYTKIVYCFSPVNFQSQIGLLPGSVEEKVAPFMEPLCEALVTLGYMPDKVISQLAPDGKNDAFISAVPHTFMRGTNIEDDTILIVDEAQNFFVDELKKVLTRVKGGKTIIIGHSEQCDLFKPGWISGFMPYIELFKDKERCTVCELTQNFRGWISRLADSLDIDKFRKEATNKAKEDRKLLG